MRAPLRRFAAVGVVVTGIDLGVLLLLARGLGWPVLVADAFALAAAACASYGLNRGITFADDPFVRWVRVPGAFATTALLAGAVDVIVLGLLVFTTSWTDGSGLALAKVVAMGVAALVRLAAYRLVLFTVARRHLDVPRRHQAPPGDVRLSVVVPALQEEARIGDTIRTLREALADVAADGGLEVVVVDDGSSDETAEAARRAGADRVVVLPRNRGKGAAVRSGMSVARGRTLAFTDADLSYAPDQLVRFMHLVEDGWDVVVGSRKHTETATLVRAGRVREVGGRVINLFTYAVLLGQYRDTQCGIKAFRSDVARLLFGKARIDGFAFDVELFHLAERYELSVAEVPVRVENSTRSSVRVVRDALRLLRDLVRVRRFAARGRYRPEDGELEALSGAASGRSSGPGGR